MIFLLLKRILQKHLGLHLLIPLLVIALLSILSDWISTLGTGNHHWNPFQIHLLVARASELLAVYISFLWVVAVSIKRASAEHTTRVDKLRDILPGSKKYFAIGTIMLREWFEPNAQTYLATIIHHQQSNPDFHHERVLVFYNQGDRKALEASYLDEPYAKSLASIHRLLKIPLAYLGPDEIRQVLLGLDSQTLRILGCERKILAWLRRRLTRIPAAWALRRKPHMMPYAVVEMENDYRILRFWKRGETLTLSEVETPEERAAHKTFADKLSEKIHKGNGELKEEFKFANYLLPGGC